MVFYARSFQCTEINAQSDLTNCFPNGDQIGNPLKILNRKNYPIFKKNFNSFLIVASSAGLMGLCFFLTGCIASLIGMTCCIRAGSNHKDPHKTKQKNLEINEVTQ
jgi:hypothetical protein